MRIKTNEAANFMGISRQGFNDWCRRLKISKQKEGRCAYISEIDLAKIFSIRRERQKERAFEAKLKRENEEWNAFFNRP